MASRERVKQPRRPARTKPVRSKLPRAASTPWPTLEAFFESGEGTVSFGTIDFVPGLRHTAVVSDGDNMLVALVRRRGETLHQLLDRLEQALGPAIEDQVLVDEINGQ